HLDHDNTNAQSVGDYRQSRATDQLANVVCCQYVVVIRDVVGCGTVGVQGEAWPYPYQRITRHGVG
ncbi:MAG: hypothetical protein AB7U75_22765, partial [Hyphomicrobiaceae bacterium]